VRRWLRRDYPEIVARAKQGRGILVWGDEIGLCLDDVRGRSFAPRGRHHWFGSATSGPG